MNYLQIITKSKIIHILLIIIFCLKLSPLNAEENNILFKINENSFTSIDLKNRIKYLNFVNDTLNENLDEIIKDFISVNLFNTYFINNNIFIENKDNQIKELYEKIIKNKNVSSISKTDEEIITSNLKLDFSRKIVIEQILNQRRNEIFDKNIEKDLLYKHKIKYLNIYKSELESADININKINFDNIVDLENFLKDKKADYQIKSKELNSTKNLNEKIKEKINKKIFKFTINEKDYVTFIFIEKKFKTYEGLIAQLYQLNTDEYLDKNLLNCEAISKLGSSKFKLNKKEYEYVKLNNEVKENLLQIDDYIIYSNNKEINYVFLCNLSFNLDILNSINTNEKITKIAFEIENNFITKYSKDYSLIKFYE